MSDAATLRRALAHYPTGVCVITAATPDGPAAGMAVGSFTSVSLDPPLVGFFPDKGSTSWPKIQAAGRFCVNILAADQEAVCRAFAAKAEDKFAGLRHRRGGSGAPILEGVIGWIDCDLHSVQEAGDHYLVLGRITDLEIESSEPALVFCRGSYGPAHAPKLDPSAAYQRRMASAQR
jgi:flavin reductase (DIM6/NTAB) family NADH-FMN oxidoreductase RutF